MADTGMRFAFSDEQRQLRAAVRRFCAENFGERAARRLQESEEPFDTGLWRRLGSELGVLGMSVSEDDGGAGGCLVDQAVAVEEFGASLAAGPLFGTVYLAIPALAACPPGPDRTNLLGALVAGERTAAVAVADHAGAFRPERVTLTADGDRVNGTAQQVVDATAADVLLVAAKSVGGLCLYAVEATDTQRTPLVTMDHTRPQATVTFTDSPARMLAGPGDAERVIAHALQVGAALLAAEQVGAAQHLLDLSVDYAKSRLQFGRQIGSFQAVKHRLADMLVDLEHARSTAYHAVWALGDGSDDPALAASMAKATCSDAFSRIAADTIQVHGGIGFTWEHPAHWYFKRAATDAALLGSAEQHRDRVAHLILDTDVADDLTVKVATGRP